MHGKVAVVEMLKLRRQLQMRLREGMERQRGVEMMLCVERHVPHQPAHRRNGEGGAGVGEAISAERLQRVASGEAWLRQHGFNELRVRSQGESARIELPPDQLTALMEPALRDELVRAFLDLGFTAVSLDLEGLVSGKLNRALQRSDP